MYSLGVSEVIEVPISSRIWLAATTFKQLFKKIGKNLNKLI